MISWNAPGGASGIVSSHAWATKSAPGATTPSYSSLDVRLGWSVWEGLSLSLVGQNLLQSHHLEAARGTAVERGVYGKLTWRR